MSTELKYLLLIFFLYVIPPMATRLRIPGGITAFLLGAGVASGLGWFEGDAALPLLANFGIIGLFLLAGLEVDLKAMRRDWKPLASHISLRLVVIAGLTWLLARWLGLEIAAAAVFALALITPSTGFILESLDGQPLGWQEKDWVRSIAISMEIVALAILFGALQSGSWQSFTGSLLAFITMIVLLPIAFRFFAKTIAPWAPNSEFAFVLMVALLAGYITRALGTYYLVGAFIVGITAQRFRENLPSATSHRMLFALKVFAFFFLPFYFFKAGRTLASVDINLLGLGLGALLLAVLVPLRLGLTWLQLRLILKTDIKEHRNVSIALLPNLVFGIVLSQILRDRFDLSPTLYLALITYTVGISMVPALMLKTARAGEIGNPLNAPRGDVLTDPEQDEEDYGYLDQTSKPVIPRGTKPPKVQSDPPKPQD